MCICLHECELDLLFVLFGSEAIFVVPLFNLYKVGVILMFGFLLLYYSVLVQVLGYFSQY